MSSSLVGVRVRVTTDLPFGDTTDNIVIANIKELLSHIPGHVDVKFDYSEEIPSQ